jgi:hypothetical protein
MGSGATLGVMSLDLSRRGLLLAGLGCLATGCSSARQPSRTGSAVHSRSATPAPTAPASVSPSTAPRAELPAVQPWVPSVADVTPAAKLAAVRRIERSGNRDGSVLQVIDAQYGGILEATASVLVVTRSWTLHGAGVHVDGHTFDVRLLRAGRQWRVTAVHPSRPGPRARLTAAARRVLRSDRVELPPAARRDVESGRVHDSVLTAILTLARDFHVGVSVVRSGHPLYVFGTDRLSDHPQGRAFDTWRIDGHPVIDPRTSRSLVVDYMHAAAAAGSYNVGGPYLLGAAPQWFSDDTHHDHVHAGFTH